MHIEFLVEEPSAEAALQAIVPKILGESAEFKIHPHQGKSDLLGKLPDRLKGYKAWLPEGWRIVVLVDLDREDCRRLKNRLEHEARKAGLVTKSAAATGSFQVLNRLAIEELEAWFFGDIPAIVAAYPRVSPNLGQKAVYRIPDAIAGGTAEALQRVLQNAGYFKGGLAKIEAARAISMNMDPQRNRSRSFRAFRGGLVEMSA